MSLRRRRLRVPAFFAGLLWVLIGVTDAAAIRVCAYHRDGPAHGAHEATGAAATSEAEETQGAVPEHTTDHAHAAHSAHGQPRGELASKGPSADAPSVAAPSGDQAAADEAATDAPSNDHRCDCRLLSCEGSTNAWAIETSIAAVSAPAVARPNLSAPPFTEARVASAVIPFFQPPSIAPPLS